MTKDELQINDWIISDHFENLDDATGALIVLRSFVNSKDFHGYGASKAINSIINNLVQAQLSLAEQLDIEI